MTARRLLVALLAAATALFAVGTIAERGREGAEHAHAESGGGEPGAVGADEAVGGEAGEADSHEADRHEADGDEADRGSERLLGVDVESPPLITLAIAIGIALTALAATPAGHRRAMLLAVAAIAAAWAVLDLREVFHQAGEDGALALLAAAVAALHLAATGTAARLARSRDPG
jgi:hypothetical protein